MTVQPNAILNSPSRVHGRSDIDKGELRLHKWHSNANVLENTKDTATPNIKGVYGVPGFASPVTIVGKIIFSEINQQKLGWEPGTNRIQLIYKDGGNFGLKDYTQHHISVPRSVANQEGSTIITTRFF